MVEIYKYITSKIVSNFVLGIELQLWYIYNYILNCSRMCYAIAYVASEMLHHFVK